MRVVNGPEGFGKNREHFPTPFTQKEETDEVCAATEGNRRGTEILRKLTLPTKSIDQWPTLVGLQALKRSPGSPYNVLPERLSSLVGLTIDQQTTGDLPALPLVTGTQKSETHIAKAESHSALLRHLAKNSAIYSLPSFVGPLVTLVLAPFLTHTLSHTEYGTLAILTTAIALIAGITQFGLNFACLRAYSYEYESQTDKLAVISTTTLLLLLLSVSAALTMVLAAPFLSSLLFNSPLFSDDIRLAALVVLMQNLSLPGLTWLRVEGRAVYFSIVSVMSLFINLAATLLLVGILSLGLVGALLASGGSYAIIGLCTLPIIALRLGLRLRLDIARNLLYFGLPLVANFVSTWVLQLSDRYLLGRMSSLDATASYSVAYTLGSALAIIITPFLLAWSPLMYSIAKRDDAARVYQLVFRWFQLVLLFATYGLSFVGIKFLYMFFPPAYDSTAAVIPIVAVSIMFSGLYNFFNIGIAIRRKTWFAVIFTTLAALVNVGLNSILIPLHGAMGAAVSTLIAYALLALIAYIVNQRIYRIPFEVGLFTFALLIGIVLYTSNTLLAQKQNLYMTDAIELCALICYGGCLVFLGKLAR